MNNILRHIGVQIALQLAAHGVSGLENVDWSGLGGLSVYGPIIAGALVAVYHKSTGTAS